MKRYDEICRVYNRSSGSIIAVRGWTAEELKHFLTIKTNIKFAYNVVIVEIFTK